MTIIAIGTRIFASIVKPGMIIDSQDGTRIDVAKVTEGYDSFTFASEGYGTLKVAYDDMVTVVGYFNPRGGLTRIRKADLVKLLTDHQTAIAERAAQVKPYKLCETADLREISQIRHEAYISPTNIDDWRDRCIAEITAAAQERLIAEYVTREEAEEVAARRNKGARRGFSYYVVYVDATLAELRDLD